MKRPHRIIVLISSIRGAMESRAIDQASANQIINCLDRLRRSLENGDANEAALAGFRLARLEQKAIRRKGAIASKTKHPPRNYAAEVDSLIEKERKRGVVRSRAWCHSQLAKHNGTNEKSIANADLRRRKARSNNAFKKSSP